MEKIYIKNLIDTKDFNKMMDLVGKWVFVEEYDKIFKRDKRESYTIEGFSKTGIILGYHTKEYDDDAMWGSGEYWVSATTEVPFEELDNYILTEEATPKQHDWLLQYYNDHYLNSSKYNLNKDIDDISKLEAWHIINEAVKEFQKKREKLQEERFKRKFSRMIDNWYDGEINGFDISCEPDDCYDY